MDKTWYWKKPKCLHTYILITLTFDFHKKAMQNFSMIIFK
jgi:hypothetical protein